MDILRTDANTHTTNDDDDVDDGERERESSNQPPIAAVNCISYFVYYAKIFASFRLIGLSIATVAHTLCVQFPYNTRFGTLSRIIPRTL